MTKISEEFPEGNPVSIIYGNNFLTRILAEKLLGLGCEVLFLESDFVDSYKEIPQTKVVSFRSKTKLPLEIGNCQYFFDISFFDLLEKKFSKKLASNYKKNFNLLLQNPSFLKIKYLGLVTEGSFSDEKKEVKELAPFIKNTVLSAIKDRNFDGRILRVKDVYSVDNLSDFNTVSALIKNSKEGRDLAIVEGDYFYPTFITDVSETVVKLMFSPGTRGKVFLLLPESGLFSHDFVLELLKYKPALAILSKKRTPSGREERDLENLIKAKTSLSLGLDKVFATGAQAADRQLTEGEYREKMVRLLFGDKKKPPKSKKYNFRIIYFVLGLVSLVTILTVLPFLEFFVSASIVERQLKKIAQGEPPSLRQIALSEKLASLSQEGVSKFYFLGLFENELDFVVDSSSALILVSRAQRKIYTILASLKMLHQIVLSDKDYDLEKVASDLAVDLSGLSYDLGFLESALSKGKIGSLIPVETRLLSFGKTASYEGAKIAGRLPDLLGKEVPKTYLVLFQNNSELRATGGFIGSFGLLTFSGGKLIDSEIQDVYSADGQLKGYVEPPEAIRKYLGEAAWYLRDSNWNPDFPSSARQAEWFLDKELDRKVDGVLAVDLYFVQSLLAEIGPVDLADFSLTITADNLYEKTQYQVEDNFFPGSQKKATFLTALSRALLSKIVASSEESLSKIGKVLLGSLERKDILVYLKDEVVSESLKNLSWDGSLKTVNCQLLTVNCFSDSLMVVDANLGVNKANYFLERQAALEVEINKEAVLHNLTVSLANKAPLELGPAGRYKSYLRVAVPALSEFIASSEVSFQGTQGAQDKTIEEEELVGFKTGGVLVEVAPGESKLVKISWKRLVKLDFEKAGEYALLWQKQPGTFEDAIFLKVSLPEGVVVEQSLEYNGVLGHNFESQFRWKGTP